MHVKKSVTSKQNDIYMSSIQFYGAAPILGRKPDWCINSHLRALLPGDRSITTYARSQRLRKQIALSRKLNDGPKQRGIIFVWPQKKQLFMNRHVHKIARFVAHTLYWLYVTNILPSGASTPLDEPPWDIPVEIQIRKPMHRDNIIEPNWDII